MNKKVKEFLDKSANYEVIEYIGNLQQENRQLNEEYTRVQKMYEDTFRDYQQLKDNWNKLRDYVLKKQAILFDTEYTCYSNVLDKMKEIEGNDSNE